MSDLSDIKQARKHWSNAYFNGDTATLEKIESSDFYVCTPKGKEQRQERYDIIKKALATGNWFEQDITLEENALQFLLNDRKAKVSGHGRTLANGNPLHEMNFEENWVKSKHGWKVQALHLNNIHS